MYYLSSTHQSIKERHVERKQLQDRQTKGALTETSAAGVRAVDPHRDAFRVGRDEDERLALARLRRHVLIAVDHQGALERESTRVVVGASSGGRARLAGFQRLGSTLALAPVELGGQRRVGRGEVVALTTGEFSMLKALVRHPRQPLSRDKLAQLARGREFEPFDRSLDVQISRLRKMIEPDPSQPRYIQTVWGVGYVFVPDGAE